MHYDPIKSALGRALCRGWRRRLLYALLDLLLLRSWHVRRHLRRLPRVDALDAGAGFGQYTWRLARLNKGNTVRAVDVKSEQVDDCNAFFAAEGLADRVGFEVADLTIYAREAAYDLVLCVDVMEHIGPDEQVFANFHRSLRPGGRLIISTPSNLGGSDGGFIEEHVRDGYNRDDISDKLRRAGFANVDARYSYGTPGHLSWVLSMKVPLSLLGRSRAFFALLIPYYMVVYPLCFVLNVLDVGMTHSSGTGLIVTAEKQGTGNKEQGTGNREQGTGTGDKGQGARPA